MKPVNYEQMLTQCESNSRTYEHLQQKVRMTNQQVIDKINTKKIQHYFNRKFDTKEKQMVNQICSQMREKLDSILERQTSKLLRDWNANDNLKVLDYIYQRNHILKQVGENTFNWYDEEEEYLNNFAEFLVEYERKM